jgi:hypothetical protein
MTAARYGSGQGRWPALFSESEARGRSVNLGIGSAPGVRRRLPIETLRPQQLVRTVDIEQNCLAVDFDRREHRLFCLISLNLRAQAFSESSRSVASEIGQKPENRAQTRSACATTSFGLSSSIAARETG